MMPIFRKGVTAIAHACLVVACVIHGAAGGHLDRTLAEMPSCSNGMSTAGTARNHYDHLYAEAAHKCMEDLATQAGVQFNNIVKAGNADNDNVIFCAAACDPTLSLGDCRDCVLAAVSVRDTHCAVDAVNATVVLGSCAMVHSSAELNDDNNAVISPGNPNSNLNLWDHMNEELTPSLNTANADANTNLNRANHNAAHFDEAKANVNLDSRAKFNANGDEANVNENIDEAGANANLHEANANANTGVNIDSANANYIYGSMARAMANIDGVIDHANANANVDGANANANHERMKSNADLNNLNANANLEGANANANFASNLDGEIAHAYLDGANTNLHGANVDGMNANLDDANVKVNLNHAIGDEIH